ncbi:hypothetical protein ABID16_004522 [Rhizobium aquaticum]|uniref:Autotransporter domain-containing protein n=1 Tax=Rhizobium aquaticum TaxID=1549636 RepID=A0ABV2J6B4_9HYPH
MTVTDQTSPTAQTSSKTFSLTVNASVPVVTGISPASGPASGGTVVTIQGNNFTGATLVSFGANNAISFTVVSASQIRTTAPAGLLGSVHITVRTPAGISGESAADQFTYAIPADSTNLRNLQTQVTPLAAQFWGQTTSEAMTDAVSEAFAGDGPLITPIGMGVRFNFAADPGDQFGQRTVRADPQDTLGGIYSAFAEPERGERQKQDLASQRFENAFASQTKPAARPLARSAGPRPGDWLPWAEVRGMFLTASAASSGVAGYTLSGNQLNMTAGLTHVISPTFVIGVLGGVETFGYRAEAIQGRLKGNGWTVGTYAGWKLTDTIRLDAGFAYSGIGFDGSAGAASASFSGYRMLLSGGLSGLYSADNFIIEPSAHVYALREFENGYTDSLGATQAERVFSNGRVDAGLKVTYPLEWSDALTLFPYLGLYGDYYFNSDNVSSAGAGNVARPVMNGLSARASVGMSARFAHGTTVSIGVERGGIGSSTAVWSLKMNASIALGGK